ncbi:MAG: ABC transporter ATP-binding protein, partial [Minwuiales bacterium]|nr:ABC transporter ATP-binding protein [Minwuiales bacterium]
MTAAAETSVLSVRDLRVDVAVPMGTLHAVRGIDLDLARGETLCLVGESGCGKSLTALALMDLLPGKARRQAARLDFIGEDLTRASRRRMADLRGAGVAMIFQEPMTSLNPVLTIGAQLAAPYIRHVKGGRAAARDRALELLERVGVPGAATRLKQYPHELSGGLRQRVMIAMTLMCQPALIIADEPTTALDVTIQAQLLKLLADLRRDFDLALLLITHDLGLVARFADRVAVMYAGEIVEQAATADLFTKPAHPYTRALLECLPTGDADGALGT